MYLRIVGETNRGRKKSLPIQDWKFNGRVFETYELDSHIQEAHPDMDEATILLILDRLNHKELAPDEENEEFEFFVAAVEFQALNQYFKAVLKIEKGSSHLIVRTAHRLRREQYEKIKN